MCHSSRPPSVRVDHGYSILIVCLAGASATMPYMPQIQQEYIETRGMKKKTLVID